MHFVQILRDAGPAGLLVLAILDSAGIPLIGGVDALMIWISINNPGSAYTAAAMAVLGSLIGSLILFFLARKGGEVYLARHREGPRGAQLHAWFLEYGLLTIFVPAVVPIIPLPLKVFIVCAGALGVHPAAFGAVMLVARFVRYFFIAWLALRLGSDTFPFFEQHWWELLLLAVGLFIVLYILIKRADRRRKLRQLIADRG